MICRRHTGKTRIATEVADDIGHHRVNKGAYIFDSPARAGVASDHDANAQTADGFWPLRPHKLYSLWDMIQFLLHEFVIRWGELLVFKQHYENAGIKNPGANLSTEDFAQLSSLATHLKWECDRLQIPKSIDRLWRFQLRLESGICTTSIIMAELQEIHNLISCEMDDNYFALIPKAKTVYFEKDGDDALFGPEVYMGFASARKEIKSAGNCLAVDEYDAAVFHLMRVINIGLRALASSLGIKKIANKKLEFCTDGQMISESEKAIDEKLKTVGAGARGEKWEIQNDFYRGILVDLRFFKDVVRDPIAHARKSYTENGALDVNVHVRDFMQRLAKHLKPTPAQIKAKRKRIMDGIYKRMQKAKEK